MSGWPKLKAHLKSDGVLSNNILLGLDFDGTLAPITAHPDHAAMPADTMKILSSLARRRKIRIAIVSGRSAKDIKARIGVPGVFYCGNHGLEIDGPGIRWTHAALRRSRAKLAALGCALREDLKGGAGEFLVEDKGGSLSVHYRGVSPILVPLAHKIVLKNYRRLRGDFRLMPGKKVWEIVPRLVWSKGDALLRIGRLTGCEKLIFVGDDRTDEEGFRTLRGRALTVRVARNGPSYAKFFLKDYRQVRAFLELLALRP